MQMNGANATKLYRNPDDDAQKKETVTKDSLLHWEDY